MPAPSPDTTLMPTRRFGRTELAMPVISCGGMRYQHSWNDDKAGEITTEGQQNLEATIHRALELGINHIETARGYGTSELQLGRVLPRLPREELIVQTKIGPKEAELFLETFETSMKNLQLEYVDLLGIHGINLPEHVEMVMKPGGTLEAVRQLQREGRVRHVGFSTHGLTPYIVQAIETGELDYVNIHWYYVNPFSWPAVEAAARQDMGVFIISPNEKGGKLFEPTPVMQELCAPLTPMQFNDLYCLSRPEVHTLSLGAARPSDFDEHIAGLAHYGEREKISSEIAGRLKAEMVRRLGEEWVEHWHEGLPPWYEFPGEINVHEIVRLWNFAKGLDMVPFGQLRYNLLGQADHWFPGNSAVEVSKLDLGPVLKDYPFADRLPAILAEAHNLLFEAPKKRLSESED